MFPTLFAILALSVYGLPIRRWMARWGATPRDLARIMPGDGLVIGPTYSGTLAVTVDAPPEDIWPWLVQIGYQRVSGGCKTDSCAGRKSDSRQHGLAAG